MRLHAILALTALSLPAADRTLTSDAPPGVVFFSADGKSLSSRCRDNRIRTWDVATGALRANKPGGPGSYLLAANLSVNRDSEGGAMQVWDLTEERRLQMINGAPTGRTSVSNDRTLIATSSAQERSVRVWNLATGAQRLNLPDGLGGASELVFSPDGNTLVSANYDNDIRIWNTKSGELVRRIEEMTGAMFAAAFTPDGSRLIMAGLDETVYIWDARSFQLLRKWKGHGETIAALAVSPDSRTLVTGGFDVITTRNPVKVAIWDLESGKIVRTIASPHRVISLAFSPDGKWLALTSGDNEVSMWKL